jgi:two-component system, chemotaxis family, protein-glutamate methylesterase/glutaminase
MIRVLVAEDSDTARALLIEILRDDSEIEIVGEARDGAEAIKMAGQLKPDLVTMDIQMPNVDGFTAIQEIMTTTPVPIVVISALTSLSEGEAVARALSCGALTVLQKPSGVQAPDFSRSARDLIATVKAMAGVKVVRHRLQRSFVVPPRPLGTRQEAFHVVAIAASTGGPAALGSLLPALPPKFPMPILVVQHITAGFVHGLVAWLNAHVSLPVRLAEQGEVLSAGTIYFAPDDYHLGMNTNFSALLSSDAPIGGFRPSANFLFESAANACGASTLAVILTGMGDDGLKGLRAVRQQSGYIIAQDEETSVVFGMPAAAIGAGVVDLVLPLDEIATRVAHMVTLGTR